ncbi:hypothetical protein [Tepidibacter thalassicus]|uniref:Uncharacterized protein n=1 Tax=Tepidibacter thalassicus DSM 15285 TaxID=1123350 RepID=A0A1M5NXP2_9FIRM|nr:hypothetical protein [Tepidibacter thalassicus]SHG94258.1 hypothetical protein SAMN02744040_00277 [Tepidibacter thalassicus DSM 15285]
MISLEEYQEFFENITYGKNIVKSEFNMLNASTMFEKNLLFFVRVCREVQYCLDDLDVIVKFYLKKDNKHFWNFLKIVVLDERISQDPQVFKGLLLILENLIEVADKQHILSLLRIISQKQNIKKFCDENTNLFLEFIINVFDKLLHSKEVCL